VRTHYQVVEDISLVNVYRDKRLKADRVNLVKVECRLRYQHVEHFKKLLICGLHDLLVKHAVC